MPADTINELTNNEGIPDNYIKAAIEQYAIDIVTGELARQQGLTNNIKLQATKQYAERQLIRNSYLNTVRQQLVSEQDIEQKYDELAASMKQQTEIHAKHILLATREEADIINRALIEKKHSFDELAKLFSLDDATSHRGGDLGYHLSGQFNPVFERETASLKLNTYSKPFQTELGWHIATIVDRRPATIMPYQQAATILREKLEQQALASYVQQLVEQADIVRVGQ